MQQKRMYTLVGLFVVAGIFAFIGVIMNYMGQKYNTDDDDLVVMYFEESIQGLSVGSSVVFKGVEVGKVADISLLANLKEGTFKTPVLVLFNVEDSVEDIIDRGELNDKQMLDNLIAKGLRARLVSANYLTGQLMIELVMDSKTPAVLRGTGKYWEIPTELSSFAMLSQDLEEVPLKATLANFGNIIQELEENLPEILDNINQITQKLDKALDKNTGEATKSMKSFNATMEEISKASRSIKNLTDYLERHPEALIQGKEK